MTILYQSQNILIREFVPEDKKLFALLFEDEEVTRYIPKRSTAQYLELFDSTIADYGKGPLGRWGIFDIHTQDFIGMYLTRYFEYVADQVEIGYVLAKKYWGKGIASEASSALIAYCFRHTDSNQVVAVTDLDNIGSQKVLEKAGLSRLNNLKRDEQELAYFMIERT
jgi:ribosomal-protein-alanine N-acetyltransferase